MSEDNSDSSMEEILSSIKRIIAEDKAMPVKRRPTVAEARESRSESAEEVLELTEAVAQTEATDDIAKDGESDNQDALMDGEKIAAMRASLDALATMERVDATRQVEPAPKGPLTVEDMVRELLRPMLKEWLDEKLPPLVEEIIAREIQRISRPD